MLAVVSLVSASAGGSIAYDPEATEVTIGVVPQRGYGDTDTKAMDAAGIGSVRLWFSWAQVEPERGKFNWSQVDGAVATNAKAGLTTLPFLRHPELGGATRRTVVRAGRVHVDRAAYGREPPSVR